MNNIEDPKILNYRIDISPIQAAESLVRVVDGKEVDLTAAYSGAFGRNEVIDTGYQNSDGEWMRAIVAAPDTLRQFFPNYFDTTRPYKREVYPQSDIVRFINNQDFDDARNSGHILDSGLSVDGSHHIAAPIDFQMPSK